MTFNNKTIEDLHNLLVSKEISATELQATLEKISSLEETAINALLPSPEDQLLLKPRMMSWN